MNKRITSTNRQLSTALVSSIFIILLVGPIKSYTQKIEERSMFSPVAETPIDYDIKSFTFKRVNNKLYFKFLVLENMQNINYILESSLDGKNFQPIQRKEGFKSPDKRPLLYSYKVDINKVPTEIAYRIRRISPDGNEYSEILKVTKNDQIEYIAQNNR